MRQTTKRKVLARTLMKIPGYKFEEFDSETGILSIRIREIIFETCGGNGLRWGWRARHVKSENWSRDKQRFAVLAGSSGWYAKRGNAERAMRQFIESLFL